MGNASSYKTLEDSIENHLNLGKPALSAIVEAFCQFNPQDGVIRVKDIKARYQVTSNPYNNRTVCTN